MRSRSTAKFVRVGDGSSAAARFALAAFVACAARSLPSSSSVCSRIRSEATLRARDSLASRSIPVAMGAKGKGAGPARLRAQVTLEELARPVPRQRARGLVELWPRRLVEPMLRARVELDA